MLEYFNFKRKKETVYPKKLTEHQVMNLMALINYYDYKLLYVNSETEYEEFERIINIIKKRIKKPLENKIEEMELYQIIEDVAKLSLKIESLDFKNKLADPELEIIFEYKDANQIHKHVNKNKYEKKFSKYYESLVDEFRLNNKKKEEEKRRMKEEMINNINWK